MLIDLHVHTSATPGGHDLDRLIEAAKDAGLDGLAITDIGVLPDFSDLPRGDFGLFAGVELPTSRGRWLAYPPHLSDGVDVGAFDSPDADGLYSIDVVEKLSGEGWALILVQPFHEPQPREAVYDMAGFHAIEVSQGTEPLMAKDLAIEAALALRVGVVGGSAVLEDLSVLGKICTVFLPPLSDQSSFHGALMSRDVFLGERGKRPVGEMVEQQERKRPPRRSRSRKSQNS